MKKLTIIPIAIGIMLFSVSVFAQTNAEMKKHYEDRHVIYGRCAHLTESKPQFIEQGRGLCMSRRICQRGCPLGGYFNVNSTFRYPIGFWYLRTLN